MRISSAFMDIPAPDIDPERPQNIYESNIFDHEGVSETIQPLSSHPELMSDNIPWGTWGSPAPLQEQTVWTTAGATETDRNASTDLALNRTRSGRRITQPTIRETEFVAIKAPVKVAAKKRKRPNRQVNIICTGCYRGHSPSNNLIVLCDSCDAPWHQKCHSPNIDNKVIEISEMNWFCIKCKPKQRQTTQTKYQKNGATKMNKVERPVSESQIGGNHYSEEERRAYLSSLSHDSLVKLIVRVSNEWPSVPMFPPDMQPVTNPTLSPSTTPHNNRASKPTPKENVRSALLDWENPKPSFKNASDMESNQRIGKTSYTAAPEATAVDAEKLFAAMVSDTVSDPASPATLSGITAGQSSTGISHAHASTTAPQTATTTSQTPSRATRRFPSQAAPAAARARKASFVSSNSDLLTDNESSYSQTLTPSPSQSSHVGSQHGSDYDPEDYRAYPEAGQGFQVPSTPSDLDIMAEDKNCLTFSHSFRGSAKQAQNEKPFSPSCQRRQW